MILKTAWVLPVLMMVVLILGVGGLMLAVRAIGAREVKDDHPH